MWIPKREGAPNHIWDCEVYGLALAYHKRILQLKSEQPVQPDPPEPPSFGKGPIGWSQRS